MTYQQVVGPALIVEHTGQVFALTGSLVTIGTEEDNTIVLADPRVSSHHTRIFWEPDTGTYVIEDLGSVEGTFLNEVPVARAQVLSDGDVIRIGDTVMDVDLAGAVAGPPRRRSPLIAGLVVLLLAGITVACAVLIGFLLLNGRRGTPTVTIRSPGEGDRIPLGSAVLLQATASGASDITLLEISVDGLVVVSTTSENRDGTSLLSASDTWTFETPGEHEVSAIAYTARERVSAPTRVVVSVTGPATPPPALFTPTPSLPTDTPPPLATDTPAPTDTPLPSDTPPPTFTATPTSTPVPPPAIAYFRANPLQIDVGSCTTLEWGPVSNATTVSIDQGIGEVGTPGSRLTCPETTTTYTLSATGPGGITTASVTVDVVSRLPDLVIESIAFDPSTPTQGQDAQVRITIRNVGQAAAGAFNFEWQAGNEALLQGRIPGLAPGDATVATVTWNPDQAHDNLPTEARVDIGGEVTEENENNNNLTANVTVAPASTEPETVVRPSQGELDGYVLNDGTANTGEDILVGNGQIEDETGELLSRGFLSFDLSPIPPGATIERVELRFFQKRVVGDPYSTLGNLVLDHVVFGDGLDGSDFDTAAIHSGILQQQIEERAWYIVSDPSFASWLQNDLDEGRSRMQFRLRFAQEMDGDGEEDWIAIEPSGGGLGNRSAPQLIIVFRR